MREMNQDGLHIKIFNSRNEMGEYAADQVESAIKEVLSKKEKVRMIFASAPSQDEVLAALSKKNIDWHRVVAFHMDEYVDLADETKSFGYYIQHHLLDLVGVGEAHYIAKENSSEYIRELTADPIDIVCMGIGENGHLAFNDPEVANFHDPEVLKKVPLDEVCRMQQVHDKCFEKIEDVPHFAMTLTMPVLVSPEYVFATVPAPAKKPILERLLTAPVDEKLPASILKKHENAYIYTDQQLTLGES